MGEAYQIADDIHDVTGSASELGKPVGRDAALGRPNAATHLGIHSSTRLFEELLGDAVEAIPPCAHPEVIGAWVRCIGDKLARSFRAPSPSTSPSPSPSTSAIGAGPGADASHPPPGST